MQYDRTTSPRDSLYHIYIIYIYNIYIYNIYIYMYIICIYIIIYLHLGLRRHCGSRTLYASSICWRSRFALSTLPSILAVLALAYWIIMLSASDLWTCLTSASLNSWWWSTRPDHLSNICSFLENPIPPWSQSVIVSAHKQQTLWVFTKDHTHNNHHTLGSLLALGIATTRPWAPDAFMAHRRS